VPFVAPILLVAILVSYLRGGRLAHLGDAPLRGAALLFIGIALQVVTVGLARGGVLPDTAHESYLLVLASQLVVIAWALLNWHLTGMLLVVLGLGLNATVMAVNGAMPVDPEALRLVGLGASQLPSGKHALLTSATTLPLLADVWPLPRLRTIVSLGDVVLCAGLIPLTHSLMSSRPPALRRGRSPSEAIVQTA
jgi:hypothetical protein